MISEEEFKRRWSEGPDEESLVVMANDAKGIEDLPESIAYFLTNCGLPDAAAPFLSFDYIASGLKRIYEIWGTPDDFSESEKQRLIRYLIIGSDGSGNPIAIDAMANFIVVHIDHDDGFDTVTYVNSSVFHLAHYLLEIREMISDFNKSGAERAIDDEIPGAYKLPLYEKLISIDRLGFEKGGFWKSEIGML